ncbi:DUF6053 domain-containing protein [Lysobacter enzymogenes]
MLFFQGIAIRNKSIGPEGPPTRTFLSQPALT